MKYDELKEVFSKRQLGEVTHSETAAAIHLWQRAQGFEVAEYPDADHVVKVNIPRSSFSPTSSQRILE